MTSNGGFQIRYGGGKDPVLSVLCGYTISLAEVIISFMNEYCPIDPVACCTSNIAQLLIIDLPQFRHFKKKSERYIFTNNLEMSSKLLSYFQSSIHILCYFSHTLNVWGMRNKDSGNRQYRDIGAEKRDHPEIPIVLWTV